MRFPDPAWYFSPQPKFQHRYFIHILLLVLTVISATILGEIWFLEEPDINTTARLITAMVSPEGLKTGLSFSLPLIIILLAHEMGHYLTCRYYRVDATLPYFIPAPLGIGTLGAFIKIREPIPNKKQLFDIGANGPIAGFLVSLPFIVIGILKSNIVAVSDVVQGTIKLGEPILFHLFRVGLLNVPEGHFISIHPLAFAGWIGLLATMLNLLPLGQLDGGHVVYAVLGKKQHFIALPLFSLLIFMGIFWWGWWIWAVILYFIGIRHPRMWDETVSIGFRRKILFVIVLLMFIACFMPAPIYVD